MSDTSAMAYSKGQKQRSSVKKGVLRNFAEFTGKHLCQSLFLNKVPGLRPATLLKKKLQHIFCEFCEILKNTFFFTEHLQWLLLKGRYLQNQLKNLSLILRNPFSYGAHFQNRFTEPVEYGTAKYCYRKILEFRGLTQFSSR